MARPSVKSGKNPKSIRKEASKTKVSPVRAGKERKTRGGKTNVSDEDVSEEESEAYNDEESEEEDAKSLDSDAIDDADFDESAKNSKKRKRASAKRSPATPTPKKSRPNLKKTASKSKTADDEDEFDDLEDGQEVVGTVVQAPKTGRVPPGQISQNTLNFLKQLQDPEYNDRTWFKLHEPVYRQAEKEWKDFIDEFTLLLTEADPQVPPLPPNDVIHRIYRDVRFSNDKTPYKTGLSASFSRSGRKGIFAGYHLCIKSGGSFFAAGTWCPGKNELQTIRNHILRSSRRLRETISKPEFVKLYGEPKKGTKGQRSNIFGFEDELKVAPKGVDKNHRDIDILKCRSFAVTHKLTDKEVLSPDFKEELKRFVDVTRPFVHLLNDMMTVEPDEESDAEQSDNEGEVN